MNEPKSRPEHRPRGRPALRTEQETRKMLIDAAREVFLTKGYSGTSVSVVAKHAGMSTRTIYKIIGTKEDLFQLVADDTIETMIADLDGPLAGTTPEEAIFGLARAYTTFVLSRDGVLKARAVLAEQAKFPDFRDDYVAAIQQIAHAFDERFVTLCAQISDAQQADIHNGAELLRSMISGAQRMAIFDAAYEERTADLNAWSDRCVTFAMQAFKSKGRSSGMK